MSTPSVRPPAPETPKGEDRLVAPNFITEIIERDLREGRFEAVVTRFPPEPNGYAHIGHAIASYLNFGLAHDYGGLCRLRMDDTNPETEKLEYAEALIDDMRWLGWRWQEPVSYASDHFDELYGYAVRLTQAGKAYVDSVPDEEMAELRGTVDTPGRPSPYRERSAEENLDLLARMRAGEFPAGAHVLRAKIDLASNNMKLRDPVLYRIVHAPHYRTGERWHIYPSYDFAQATTDALNGVTHSLCSLEFVDNRAIYDWLMDELWDTPRPYQIEFGRRSLEYTVVSKRKLIQLVNEGHVKGWDDPRMPTLAGLRRRGVTPEAIRDFAGRVGISRTNRTVDIALLEYSIREDLNFRAPRVMAVLDPLKVVITNYPEGETEELEASYWPHDVPREGSRAVPFARELYIERSDFAEDPPKGFKRLAPGGEVRLRYAYVISCDEVVKNAAGEVTELRCSYDPATLGTAPQGRKVKGTVHWVPAQRALPAEFRLYDRLFTAPNPDAGERPFTDYLNPESLVVRRGFVEPSVADDPADTRYQFERQGYFRQDPVDSRPDALVFNRIVTLRDSWTKAERDEERPAQPQPERRAERAAKAAAKDAGKAPRDPLLDFTPEQRARYARYTGEFGLGSDDAALLAGDAALSEFFERALESHSNAQALANWTVNEVQRELKGRALDDLELAPRGLAALVALVDEGAITHRVARDVFAEMVERGGDPAAIVKEKGLEQVADEGALEPVVDGLFAANPDKVAAYRGGKTGLLGFFVGGVMRETQGKANPQLVQELVKRKLG